MSYKSIRTIASMFMGVVLAILYGVYALGSQAPGPEDVGAWALAMLVFVGISIGVAIVVQILFHIAYSIGIAVKEREKEDQEVERILSSLMVEDEMDWFINLRSESMGYYCVGAGFLGTLLSLSLGMSVVPALHIALGSFFFASLVEGATSIYGHEKGFRRGK